MSTTTHEEMAAGIEIDRATQMYVREIKRRPEQAEKIANGAIAALDAAKDAVWQAKFDAKS